MGGRERKTPIGKDTAVKRRALIYGGRIPFIITFIISTLFRLGCAMFTESAHVVPQMHADRNTLVCQIIAVLHPSYTNKLSRSYKGFVLSMLVVFFITSVVD